MTVLHHPSHTDVRLHETVELVHAVEAFAPGTRGIVVDAYPARDRYTVEVTDGSGHLLALLPCRAADLRPLS